MIPHIKILILNWNGCELTLNCLKSVLQLDYSNFSVSVIDNGSYDDSINSIKKSFPEVEILELQENVGFSMGYNYAFSKMRTQKIDYYWILNNDTTVSKKAIFYFLKSVKIYGEKHIYGSLINYMDKPSIIWYAGAKVDLFWGILSHNLIRKPMDLTEIKNLNSETDYITGCSIFTSKETINMLDGFDNSFNMYGEDVDLCLRARVKGVKCYFVYKAVVFHKVSASIGGEFSLAKIIKRFNSVLILMKKHTSTVGILIGFPLFLIRSIFFGIYSVVKR